MKSYICISHVRADREAAEKFFRELSRYGFRYQSMDETLPRADRESLLRGGAAVLVLTSPVAADLSDASRTSGGSCASDIRFALGLGRRVLCVSLEDNALNTRFCANAGRGAELVAVPSGAAPDIRTMDFYMHRLYLSRLCRLDSCFSEGRCVDDVYGRTVKAAVAAHAGNPSAQWILGQAYGQGQGAPVLEAEAAAWTDRAALGGVVDAMIRMAGYKLDGVGTSRDVAAALALYTRAAEAGDVRGVYYRGLCCLYGYGMMRDPDQAVSLLAAAARGGYPPARYRLALMYRDGVGTQPDWRAAAWNMYTACAELTGYWEADSRIGTQAASTQVIPLCDRRPACLRGKDRDTRRMGYHCISMRRMKETALRRALYDSILRTHREGRTVPAAADVTACFRRSMRRCHYTRTVYREEEWLALSSVPSENDLSRDVARYNRKQGISGQRWDVSLAAGGLGRLLELGDPANGICPSPLQALRWYRRAMVRGHSGAMFRLADCYRRGAGVPRDMSMAVKLYRRAAELGSERGQFALAVCYERGEGVPQDMQAAVHWYEKAAMGDSTTTRKAARSTTVGTGEADDDKRKNVAMTGGGSVSGPALVRAVPDTVPPIPDGGGYAPAQNNLGGCLEHGWGVTQDLYAAVKWYTRAAAAGQPDAACRLGLCYEQGRGVETNMPRAEALYEQAVRQGHTYAMYRLALCYDRGMQTASRHAEIARYTEAARLYRMAAQGGVAEAAYAMGLCVRYGRGVPRDGQEAFEWFAEAAELGSVQGACEAGICLLEGRDTVRSRDRAAAMLTRAVELWDASRRADDPVMEGRTAWDDIADGGSDKPPFGGIGAKEAAGEALCLLGYCTLYGAEPQVAAAFDWFVRAAGLGHAGAWVALGDMLTYGLLNDVTEAEERVQGILTEKPAPDRLAVACYRQAVACPDSAGATARRGRVEAVLTLADMTPEDRCLPDFDRLLAEVAAKGEPEALIRLASDAFGDGQSEQGRHRAADLLSRAYHVGGSPEAALWLGDLAFSGWDIPDDAASSAADCPPVDRMNGHEESGRNEDSVDGSREDSVDMHREDDRTRFIIRAVLWYLQAADGDLLEKAFGDTAPALLGGTQEEALDADTYCHSDIKDPAYGCDAEETWLDSPARDPGDDRGVGAFCLIRQRREARQAAHDRAVSAACGRLTVLLSLYGKGLPARSGLLRTDDSRRRITPFGYLTRAVLSGEPGAGDDLARLYAIYRQTVGAVRTGAKTTGGRIRFDRSIREMWGHLTMSNLMKAYYADRNIRPWPFVYTLACTPLTNGTSCDGEPIDGGAVRDDGVLSSPVTPDMYAEAMNFLGDCLFYGQELPRDREAAVACYRKAASVSLPAGTPVPGGMVWAWYSLGFCLLRGLGCAVDAREGVRWLTRAAKRHGEAACLLAECYETGEGTEGQDSREAVKYYRKAMALGCRRAEARLAALEKKLRSRLN